MLIEINGNWVNPSSIKAIRVLGPAISSVSDLTTYGPRVVINVQISAGDFVCLIIPCRDMAAAQSTANQLAFQSNALEYQNKKEPQLPTFK